jgi:hypothetical protein
MEPPVRQYFHTVFTYLTYADIAIADGDDLLRCIIDAASRLDRQQVPLEKFGIQFVQIGTDQDAARSLQVLDDELSDRYKIRVRFVRDFSHTFTHDSSGHCRRHSLRPC